MTFARIASLLLCLLFSSVGFAQDPGDPPPVPDSPLVKRLASFDRLPDVHWEAHAGDLAHGERSQPGDPGWMSVKPGYSSSPAAIWLRTTVTVPATVGGWSIAGSKLWLHFSYARGPLQQIIYVNGNRVALGEDLEPTLLVDGVKGGEVLHIAVKVLEGAELKQFSGSTIRVEPPATRPSPMALAEEARTVAIMAPRITHETDIPAKVEQILKGVDFAALDKGDQKRFDVSLTAAHEKLMHWEPALKQVVFDRIGHAHIDAAWRWTEAETIDVVRRTYGTALQLMSEYPQYKFTQSAAAYNNWLADNWPVIDRGIKKQIDAGRWEIVGGMWVEPDLVMPDGEAIVRQLLLGKRFYRKHYGVDVKVGWNPDSFGYSWQLPQIYKKSGIDYFVTQKMSWNDTNKLPLKLFWWESPDGSKILTYFPQRYSHSDLSPAREAKDFAVADNNNPGTRDMLDLFGIGDHGGGATRPILDEGVRWMQPNTVAPTLKFTLPSEFFHSAEKTITGDSPTIDYKALEEGWKPLPALADGKLQIPTWKDELYLEFHRGIFTTQAKHKRNMRRSESELLSAEKFASFAWLRGTAYPGAEFEDSWRKVSFGQFHDLAAGSGIAQIYVDADRDYKHVTEQTEDANRVSLASLLATVDTRSGGGVPVALFNALSWVRSGLVSITVQMPDTFKTVHVVSNGGKVLQSQIENVDEATNTVKLTVWVPEIPAMGYTVLHVLPGEANAAKTSAVNAHELTLDNGIIRAVVDAKTGCITSLVANGFESIAKGGCGNELQTFTDTPKRNDAWNIDIEALATMKPIKDATSVKLVERTPMRAAIEIERVWGKSHFTQRLVLRANEPFLRVENRVDWREDHVLLKAAMPLAASSDHATYEIPYGTIERPTTRNNSYEKVKFEVPALRWADLGDGAHGLSILNDAKYGYDAEGNRLRITLLKSPKYPDPEADMGIQQFTYALYPHATDWKRARTMQLGYEYNYPIVAEAAAVHGGSAAQARSFASIDSPNVIVTAVKKAEDSDDLVIRMYDWSGTTSNATLTVPTGPASATMADMMEKSQGSPLALHGDKVALTIHPYEIVTVKVAYPRSK